MCKIIVWGGHFCIILVDVQKSTVKIGMLEHFQKKRQGNKKHFEGILSGASRGDYLVHVGCV